MTRDYFYIGDWLLGCRSHLERGLSSGESADGPQGKGTRSKAAYL